MEEALEIYRAFDAENQGLIEFKGGNQAIHDFSRSGGIDFKAHGLAFAALCDLRVYGFEQAARFLFFQVEIAVACDAEGRGTENFVAPVKLGSVTGNDVVQENVVDAVARRWHA